MTLAKDVNVTKRFGSQIERQLHESTVYHPVFVSYLSKGFLHAHSVFPDSNKEVNNGPTIVQWHLASGFHSNPYTVYTQKVPVLRMSSCPFIL